MKINNLKQAKEYWNKKDYDNFIISYMPVVENYAKEIYKKNSLVLNLASYEDVLQDGYLLLVRMVKMYKRMTFVRFYQAFKHYYEDNANIKYNARLKVVGLYYKFVQKYNKIPTYMEFYKYLEEMNHDSKFSFYHVNNAGLEFAQTPVSTEFEELVVGKIALRSAMNELDDKYEDILIRNVANGETLDSIAESYECTRENVRRVRNTALRKVKRSIEK